jgi:hypothetical protein
MASQPDVANQHGPIRQAHDARQYSDEESSHEVVHDAMPPSSAPPAQQIESPENIRRTLRFAPTHVERTLQRVAVVLAALVVMCLVMAAIVWWRLLS